MSKKFYLLFTQLGKLQPKIYKTLKSINQHQLQHPEYKVRQYDNQNLAKDALMIYRMERQRYILNEQQVKLGKKIESIKSSGQCTALDQVTDESSSNDLKQTQNNTGQNINNNTTITTPKQNDSGIIKPKLQQINQRLQSLLTLTPSMSKLLTYYSPTPSFIPTNPTLNYSGYFDGCSKSNPGKSSVGYFMKHGDSLLFEGCWPVGIKTNNQAEFLSLLYLLVDAYTNGVQKVSIFGDSKLAVDVVTGKMKASSQNIIEYAECTRKLIRLFPSWKIEYINRIYNTRADKLSNEGLKKKLDKEKTIY